MTHPSPTDEIVARCLDKVREAICDAIEYRDKLAIHNPSTEVDALSVLTGSLQLTAQSLRTPTPTSAPPSGVELYTPRMNDGWRTTDYERNTAAERLIEAVRTMLEAPTIDAANLALVGKRLDEFDRTGGGR